MTRHAHRLPRWQRLSLHLVGGVLLASGALWLALHYSTPAGALPNPLEVWAIRVHGLAAFGGLFMLGVLAAAHVPHGWWLTGRQRRAVQRGSGLALCGLGGVLVITGYLLYYFAPESLRPALGWLHSLAGVAAAALIAFHQRRKPRQTRSI